jgi:hypothetical protein
MPDLQQPMGVVVERFTSEISALVHALVEEVVSGAVDAARAAARRRLASMPATPARPSATLPQEAAAPRAKGAKRNPDDIEQLRHRVFAFIRVHPGLRIEQINAELGTTTAELMLPLRKLVADGEMRTEGAKRSTKYFAVASSTPQPVGPAAPPIRRRRSD